MFELEFVEDWDDFFEKFDNSSKNIVWKKIMKLKYLQSARHLCHGLQFFVVEVGQYRICFEEINNVRRIVFVGNHKQYEKWYKK